MMNFHSEQEETREPRILVTTDTPQQDSDQGIKRVVCFLSLRLGREAGSISDFLQSTHPAFVEL